MRFGCYVCVLAGVLAAAPLPGTSAPKRVATNARLAPVIRADPRSGQLVKTISITPRPAASRIAPPKQASAPSALDSNALDLKTLIAEAAKQYEISPELVDSVIQVESNYNTWAVSPKGAQGLMQLMPDTARRFGVRNSFDAKENIQGGVRYLKFLQDTFKDDSLAIAAYNAGEGAVQKYGHVPPYAETIHYVANVGKRYGQARRRIAATTVDPQTAEQQPKIPEYRKLTQYVDSEGRIYLTTQ